MARSNKPLVWGPFAAGGTITAFLTPVLILLVLLAALGHVPDGLAYERLRAFAAHPLAGLVIFGVIALSLWSAAHRLRITFFDFGVRQDRTVATVVYATAIAASAVVALALARL